ncbi:MAG: amino acid permease [Cytophagales bacterium]|nr:amino acid permease [Bernardetiaceae bacterium]MDW8210908.1 amino acid permease [Cytophagales bacterium]
MPTVQQHFTKQKHGLGSFPVFFLSLCTLQGALMILWLGHAIGHLGLIGAIGMVGLAHLITIPTAMAFSEIATNQKVEGGGEYFIISRSFGITVAVPIGVMLYIAQTILTAIYLITFSRAFKPFFDYLLASPLNIYVYDYRVASFPAFLLLTFLLLRFGSEVLLKLLYLTVPLMIFGYGLFLSSQPADRTELHFSELTRQIDNPLDFFTVLALCFPMFGGMTAGLSFSKKLDEPRRSLPRGIIGATVVGFLGYLVFIFKLYMIAPLQELVNNPLVMADKTPFGVEILFVLGLVSTLSAASSFLMASRTLQALASDRVLPNLVWDRWLSRINREDASNPLPEHAIQVTAIAVFLALLYNDMPSMLEGTSILLCLTFGSICMISFLEHFAADPAYRPLFRTRWYISLAGAMTCIFAMINMNLRLSLTALVAMVFIYMVVNRYQSRKQGLSVIFQGVIFQLSRTLQIFLQKARKEPDIEHWRPSIICISTHSFERVAAFQFLRWISHKYGFGTYIHLIEGYLSKETHRQSKECYQQLIKISDATHSNVYIDTLVSPSAAAAISQVIQLPGISGKENNVIMFEFSKSNPEGLSSIAANFQLVRATDFDAIVLGSSDRNFGYHSEIDIWITSNDYENATLMILLGYIILGHPDWSNASIKIFAVYPENEIMEQKQNLMELINSGRLPISPSNIELIPKKENVDTKTIINQKSKRADLTIIGIRSEAVKHSGEAVFMGYDGIGDVLFVNTKTMKSLR